MGNDRIAEILQQISKGKLTAAAAEKRIQAHYFEDLGYAKVDHHRGRRSGFPEVILCEGKEPEQVAAIAKCIVDSGCPLLATRADPAAYRAVRRKIPKATYHRIGRVITNGKPRQKDIQEALGPIAVICAGTSDIPVAEEAATTAEMMGNQVVRTFDVGVAGIHRLLAHAKDLRNASVLIVVAGMEGALPSVVGGLVSRPVVAVPTSVGYGASFGGVAALLGMLNSCASGVTVVNIDNGFGAAYAASLMNRLPEFHGGAKKKNSKPEQSRVRKRNAGRS